MYLVWGTVGLVVVTAVAVTAMLLVRRRAPEGSYFSDGDRASGVFGVLATGFSVLLGFIIFLAFSSYDASRSGAETEATIVAQQVQTAQFLPGHAATSSPASSCATPATSPGPSGTPRPRHARRRVNPWGVAMFHTISSVEPRTATEQSAYDRWMDQTSDREQARIDRVHGPRASSPRPLWPALFAISA